ncbi:Putative rhamnosyl transferase [Paracoccus aminovorans]|uniref:Putative rhamnosyl transferase n=1 Tax=Paracoccus aminovorans TaxID=34004 RepID=A0A1I3FEE9_9RHOB|nr:glycosyltransferase [Paracoccus aminovorans]CQR86459.1 hypothetical protein JCM7685_1895 [Paracoccus aminovorans]SFI09566.1 Putative rhamnosyl transferase [Paracoccus aminovorans]
MADLIVGICRFSYLGRGDWAVYAGLERGSAAEMQARERAARTLYDPARLEMRFRSFETLTLPSIKAQRQPDFQFIVLTSPAMPPEYRSRLERLCAGDGRLHLLVSEAPDVGAAIEPLLAQLSEGGRHRLMQFRLDDDDCLGVDYMTALHRATAATRDYEALAFSMPRGLLVSHYTGAGPAWYELDKPFHSAGAALRPRSPAQCVYSFGHYALMRRFPSVLDPRFHGSLQLKLEGHDSRPVQPGPRSGLTVLQRAIFAEHLARAFPFVDMALLEELLHA